jgi:hemerythrin-like domain-containing protein
MENTTEPDSDRVITPLREARRPLFEGMGSLLLAADAVTAAEARVALASLDTVVGYLRDTVIPAHHAENYTMLIAMDGILGQPGSSDIIKAQHRSINAMAGDLLKVVDAARADGDLAQYARYLLPLLYGLYAAIRVHLESEEDAWLPLMDAHLSESQVGGVVENVSRIMAGDSPGAQSP